MSLRLHRILYLWACVLVIALLVIIPLATWVRAFGMLLVVCCVAWALVSLSRHAERQRRSVWLADNMALPAASFSYPVMLVCGDGLEGLFGTAPAAHLALRVTEHGCYVRVPRLEQLPAVIDGVLALRPDWCGQLGLMFIVNPAAHSDGAALAGQVRVFCHQVSVARKRGIALPLLLVSYLQTLHGEEPWFSWAHGQAETRVHEAGACIGLDEWQQQSADPSTQAARMQASIQLSSVVAWLHEAVLVHLAMGHARGPLALTCAVKLVPTLPQTVPGNLWQQRLRSKLALADNRPVVSGALVPFPDPLLSVLKPGPLRSPVRRAGVMAVWLFAGVGVVALASSAWQNILLVRQISDDLRRYTAIEQPNERDPCDFVRREHALSLLRQDAHRLAAYHRHGAPLAFGLGLYRGEDLRAPLRTVLAAHIESPRAPTPAGLARKTIDCEQRHRGGANKKSPR